METPACECEATLGRDIHCCKGARRAHLGKKVRKTGWCPGSSLRGGCLRLSLLQLQSPRERESCRNQASVCHGSADQGRGTSTFSIWEDLLSSSWSEGRGEREEQLPCTSLERPLMALGGLCLHDLITSYRPRPSQVSPWP